MPALLRLGEGVNLVSVGGFDGRCLMRNTITSGRRGVIEENSHVQSIYIVQETG